jgi:hypothetical protein
VINPHDNPDNYLDIFRGTCTLCILNETPMAAFSIITGIVTLIGFLLQIRGCFPKYRRYYSFGTLFLFGLTAGFALASLTGVSIHLPDSISAKNIMGFSLFGGAGLLVFVCFCASALISDSQRRSEVSKIGSAVSGFLIFLLIFFNGSFFPASPDERPMYLTYDEQVECARTAASRQNFERSLLFIEDLLKILPKDDPRRTNLEKFAEQVRSRQAALPTTEEPKSGAPIAK